jgi:hypothetical protein
VVAPTTTAGVTAVMTLALRATTATDTATIGATLGVMTRRPDAATTVAKVGGARVRHHPSTVTIAGARRPLVASMKNVAREVTMTAAMTVVMGLVVVGRTRIAVGTTAGTTGLTSALRALRTESPLSRPVERCSAVYCRSKDMNVLAWISSLQNPYVGPAENWTWLYIRGRATCAHARSWT